jgi:hypothetical protein
MTQAFIIETDRHAAGVVVAEHGGVRFHAALPLFQSLDGRQFHTPEAATRACEEIERRWDALPPGIALQRASLRLAS